MRLSSLLGAALGTGLLVLTVSSGANAWDGYRDRDHWRYDHHRYEHWRHERPVVVHERPVVVRERPMVVERAPVYVAPQPMYVQPVMPQGPSGLNLNFNIPLN
jgi:hypothetical protein